METKKTARQLFQEHLSKDDFEKILKYENEAFNYEYSYFRGALLGVFSWNDTEEGFEYWDKIYTNNKSLEKNLSNDDFIKNWWGEEKVNHPSHYGGKNNPFEPIKIIEHYNLNFNLGNIVKYTLRAGKKEDLLQDLQKAKWYIEREIERLKNNSSIGVNRDKNCRG
jgi:hypothetical protein